MFFFMFMLQVIENEGEIGKFSANSCRFDHIYWKNP